MPEPQKSNADSTFIGSQNLQGEIQKRRMAVIMIVTAFLILLVIYNVANFLFLHQIAGEMEKELGLRLLFVARFSAITVENEFPESLTPGTADHLVLAIVRNRLHKIRQQHQVEGLYIIDRNRQTLLDSYNDPSLMISRTYLEEDSTYIDSAWRGLPSVSPLHEIRGQKFKSAYAPIRNINGQTIGVLVAEANAYFFQMLDSYRSTFYLTAGISAAVFVLFTGFLIYALRLLIRTQENLNRSQRLAMLGQMAAVLAHEIRNPLGIIRGTADVLKSRYQPADKNDPLFEYIPDEVNRLNKLVNNFLFLSKAPAVALVETDLNKLIESVLEKARLDEYKQTIHWQFEPQKLKPFLLDPNAVEQVFMNLVRNAIQAIDKEGDIIISTALIKKRSQDFVQITVRDTGSGIEGDPRKIFEPFYTTKSTGSGLGMAVSKKIVEALGGWIDISSSTETGTTVTFALPYRITKNGA